MKEGYVFVFFLSKINNLNNDLVLICVKITYITSLYKIYKVNLIFDATLCLLFSPTVFISLVLSENCGTYFPIVK